MSCTGSFPRKWSIRNRRSSGKIAVRRWFSSRADARSVPNGFSTTSRLALADQALRRELLRYLEEHRRRRREVEDGHLGTGERIAQPVVQRALLGVAADVRHAQTRNSCEHLLVELVLFAAVDGLGRMADELVARAADCDRRR